MGDEWVDLSYKAERKKKAKPKNEKAAEEE